MVTCFYSFWSPFLFTFIFLDSSCFQRFLEFSLAVYLWWLGQFALSFDSVLKRKLAEFTELPPIWWFRCIVRLGSEISPGEPCKEVYVSISSMYRACRLIIPVKKLDIDVWAAGIIRNSINAQWNRETTYANRDVCICKLGASSFHDF